MACTAAVKMFLSVFSCKIEIENKNGDDDDGEGELFNNDECSEGGGEV